MENLSRSQKNNLHIVSEPLIERINNLPVVLSSFLGREEERKVIADMLLRQEVRLLTLTGMGGVGKTRLALAVALEIQENFTHGVCFVPLATNFDPEQVLPSLAQALGLQTGTRSTFEMVHDFLHDKHLLLVLDNFEQVVAASSSLTTLLKACEGVTMLVTSRETLHVEGEYEFAVLPFTVPEDKHISLEKLAVNPSVALFLERAQATLIDFQLTPANAEAVAGICVYLEGLPLALELAAARIKLLSPQALLARLSNPLHILTLGPRDVPARQQTLRNTIQWSYDLLSPQEQRLFRCLSIFIGGCTIEAVEAVYSVLNTEATDLLEGITSLVDKSLIRQEEQEDGKSRVQMLETIRAFGLECLQVCGELERIRQAHASYYLTWAETTRKVMFGRDQGLLLSNYVLEQWNWRSVMTLVLEQQDKSTALQLASGLSIFWLVWGYSFDQIYLVEGKKFLEQVLSHTHEYITVMYAWVMSVYGGVLALLRDLGRADAACQEGLALARRIGNIQYIITSIWMKILALITRDDFKVARVLIEEAVSLARSHKDTFTDWSPEWLLGYSLHRAGYVALWQGRYTDAKDFLSETITVCNQTGELFFALWSNLLLGEAEFFEGRDEEAKARFEFVMSLYKILQIRTLLAEAQGFLGGLLLRSGDVEGAHMQISEALHLRREVGDEQGIAWTEVLLARVEYARQNFDEACHLLEDALTRAFKAHGRLYTAMGLQELGRVAAKQGKPLWATRLLGAAEALRESMESPLPSLERAEHEMLLAELRVELGTELFRVTWKQGHEMTPQQAFSEREGDLQRSSASSTATKNNLQRVKALGLTRRELEVLHLLAEGLSTAQIAERLQLSAVTINTYLRSLYQKLGVSSRTAAMRYALDHGLLEQKSSISQSC